MWVYVCGLIGGMGLLLYGMYVLSEGLQKIAGANLRNVLSSLTQNRFVAMVIGALITILFQSSTATTVILVGLASASIITLKQTLGVILGADIGTTVTAQLIALKVTEIALPIVGIGATIIFFTKRDRYKRIGQVITGFGLLFLGLKIMSETMYPLRDEPAFLSLMTTVADNPLLAIIVAALFTFLIHSSAAAVGIIMIFAIQDLVTLHSAIYLLFGANIGTSFTALLSSLGSNREAQRVAVAHFLFKLVGVLIFLPFVTPFAALMQAITPNIGFQVANVHTFFNVGIALFFIPFISHCARFLTWLVPDKGVVDIELKPRYLDYQLINTPSIAMGLASKEIARFSDEVVKMTCRIRDLFETNDPEELEKMMRSEEKVDCLSRATKSYLAMTLRQPLSTPEFNRCMGLIHITTDLEHIGDVIDKKINRLAEKKIDKCCDFSVEGWEELTIMHERVCTLLERTHYAFVNSDLQVAQQSIRLAPKIRGMERELRRMHIHRLAMGVQRSEATSSIHLDLINSYLTISEHVRNIALAIAEEVIGARPLDQSNEEYPRFEDERVCTLN
jgi:phosphate:Na+ symporter